MIGAADFVPANPSFMADAIPLYPPPETSAGFRQKHGICYRGRPDKIVLERVHGTRPNAAVPYLFLCERDPWKTALYTRGYKSEICFFLQFAFPVIPFPQHTT